MAYKKKSYKRKYYKKRYTRKGKYGSSKDNKVYNFKQHVVVSEYVATATPRTEQHIFKFSDLSTNNRYAFQDLFDQYRINKVTFKILPNFNMVSPTRNLEPVWSAIDYDGNSSSLTKAELEQYRTFKQTVSNRSHIRSLVPQSAKLLWSGTDQGTDVLSPNTKPVWIDINATNVPHYGLWFGVPGDDSGSEQLAAWTIQIDYYLSFRNVH